MSYQKTENYDPVVTAEIASHVKAVLKLLGEDPEREGLLKTPERVAKSLQFLTQGYGQSGTEIIRSAIFDEKYKQMVIVKDIEMFSMCEHHILPFIGNYRPQQGRPRCRHIRPQAPGPGAPHRRDSRRHPGGAAPARCRSGHRSHAHLHDDARRREIQRYHHHVRIFRHIPQFAPHEERIPPAD